MIRGPPLRDLSAGREMPLMGNVAQHIANPTHYAVALNTSEVWTRPCVLLQRAWNQGGLPIVENPPLARALHATVEIDQQIPPEHYKAVAEVIGYVMRLRRAVSLRR
ncbi:MAG: EscU/YscU/HrcU family type III secretion system export apparatus switch protein [Pseudolabrys sp.]